MNRSKAPKTNSRMVSEETIQLAIKVSTENYNIGPKNTAFILEKQYNITYRTKNCVWNRSSSRFEMGQNAQQSNRIRRG